jgi:hypothetical protein
VKGDQAFQRSAVPEVRVQQASDAAITTDWPSIGKNFTSETVFSAEFYLEVNMKRFVIILVLLCYSAASNAELSDSCVNECISKGYQYYLCESRCTSSVDPQAAQREQPSQPEPQTANEINSKSKNESLLAEPFPSTEPTDNQVRNDDTYKRHPYGYLDYGLFLFSNAPKSYTDGFQIGVGYLLNKHLGIEGGISLVEDATSDNSLCGLVDCVNESLGVDSSQIYAIGILPVNNENALFGKLGWAKTTLTYSYSDTPCLIGFCGSSYTGSASASKTNTMFGFGWEMGNKRLKFRVQYENYGTIKMITTYSDGSTQTFDIGIEVISAGFTYNF